MTFNSGRAFELFTEAVQLPVGDRAAFLERACAGDCLLRRKVEALLRSSDRAGDFLEEPPTGSISEGRVRVCGEKPGDRIGHFKLLEQIGEGGCGIVFLAEQEEPVRRQVALKIIKPGMDSRSVIARFEAERQALALMDHPNIAKIFDAGTTVSGRPFFVMELVRGVKITEFCDQHSLSTRARLNLFVQVCQAIQHAHQKGVIHRDIKPSNILVTKTAEDSFAPVIIDFGIAKATSNQQLADSALFTAVEMLIGTPAYMSPEQAAYSATDVDTRSDIYSLGVLLYELLTGSTPFDTVRLLKAGLDEVRRVICEQEPLRPSTRLSNLAGSELTTVALRRHSEPPTLIRAIRGDLDWIAMKALEKDRGRRYPTANALARDVQRFIANEAISARPPSAVYKLRKTVERNRLLFSGMGVIAFVLIAGLIVVSSSLRKERRSRLDAQSASIKSDQIKRFLGDMLQGVEPSVALGQDTILLRGILDRTADRIGKEMSDQPAVEAELRSLIGRLYFEIGNYDAAEKMHREALAFYKRETGPKSLETASSLNDLGIVMCKQGRLKEARTAHEDALVIRRVILGGEHADIATSLKNLATVHREQRSFARAEELIRESLGMRRRLFGLQHLAVADSLHALCLVLVEQPNGSEAEKVAREALSMRRRLLGSEHPLVAASLLGLASALNREDKLEEAEAAQEEAFAMQRKLLGDEHPDVSTSLSSLGDLMKQQGNLREARLISSAAITMQRKMFGDNSPEVLKSLRNLASTFESRKKFREAENLYRDVLEGWRNRNEAESVQGLYAVESITRVQLHQKKSAEAERLLDEVLTLSLIQKTNSAKLLNTRAKLKARRGQWQQAASDAVRAFEHRPADHTRFPVVAALLIRTENRVGYENFRSKLITTWSNTTDYFVADQVAKACLFLPCSETDLPILARLADAPVTRGIKDEGAMPYFEMLKALSEYRQAHYTPCVEWCRKVLARPPKPVHAHATAILAMAYWQLSQREEARAMLAKGDSLAPPEMPAYVAEDSGDDWKAWMYARVQLDEAAALIGSGATHVDRVSRN